MNRSHVARFLLLTMVLATTGCASVPAKGGFADVQRTVSERLGQRIEWNQGTAEDQAATKAMEALLDKPLTAESAVQITLLNNGRLQAVYEDLGVAQAALVQAGLLKNPRFGASYLPATVSGPGPIAGLDLAQDFLALFFVGLRKQIAESEFESAKARVTAAVLDTAGETQRVFLELQAADQLAEMQSSVVEATAASSDAATKLFEAGNITKLALANERALHAQAKLDLAAAQATGLAQRERLTSLMGLWGPAAGSWQIATRLPEVPDDDIHTKGLEVQAIAQSLDLAQVKARMEVAAGRAGMTQWSSMLSEIEIGVGADREDDKVWHVGPTVSLQVPIFDQGQAKNAAAASELRRAIREYSATAIEVRSSARAARDRAVAAQERARFYRQAMLPLRDEIVRESQLAYNGMLIGVFQLLAVKRDEINAGSQYIEALRDYWVARAELELILKGGAGPSPQTVGRGAPNRSASSRNEEH